MYHAADGWWFERDLDGSVTIYKCWTPKGDPRIQDDVQFRLRLPPEEWASVVASMCATGEHAASYTAAIELHGKTDSQARIEAKRRELLAP